MRRQGCFSSVLATCSRDRMLYPYLQLYETQAATAGIVRATVRNRRAGARILPCRSAGGATPIVRLLAELTKCAERLGRSPTIREFEADPQTRVHPQTVIERFGTLERRQAEGWPGTTPLHDPCRSSPSASGARRGARARSHLERSRVSPRQDAVEVPLLAYVRIADDRPAGGWVRHSRGGRAPRASDRAGREAGASPRAPAEVRRLDSRSKGRSEHAHRVAGVSGSRRRPRGVVDAPVPRARAAARRGRPGRSLGPRTKPLTPFSRRFAGLPMTIA